MLLVLIRVSSYANSGASLSSVPFVVESHPILAVSRNAPPSSLRGGERCVTPKKKKKKNKQMPVSSFACAYAFVASELVDS